MSPLPTGTENYPPGWEIFEHYLPHVGARSFDFVTNAGEVILVIQDAVAIFLRCPALRPSPSRPCGAGRGS